MSVVRKGHSESFNKDIVDSFQEALNSQSSSNSISVGQSSRRSTIDTSTSGYDVLKRGGIDDEGDDNAGNDGGNVRQQQQSQYPRAYSLKKTISRTVHKIKTVTLEDLVQVQELLGSCIKEEN